MAKRLGDILVEKNLVDRETVEAAAAATDGVEQRLGEFLARGISLEEADLYRALAEQQGFHFSTADDLYPRLQPDLLQQVSDAYLLKHRAVPICRDGDQVEVATSSHNFRPDELSRALDVGPDAMLIHMLTPTDFTRIWMDLHSDRPLHRPPLAGEPEQRPDDGDQTDLLETEFAARSYLVGLLGAILLDAVGQRATDVHFERFSKYVRLRFRIDGELRTIDKFPMTGAQLRGLINVVKIQCELDITERRRPQGGRMRRTLSDQTIDMRIQTQPVMEGENLVIRLLPHQQRRFSIDDVGFTPQLGNRYKRLLGSPSGMILFVGPTGSGKTTSLYAGISILSADETRKVITVEDPIEYAIDNIQQTQINELLGLNFASAMRVIVREDPDAILLGEIRDPETALEAARASQTGHLVLSTLHCNDAVDAVQRLFDLGLHPNSIAAELQAIFAQRLCPRICTECRKPVPLDPDLVSEVFPDGVPGNFTAYAGAGCERCHGRGSYGRIAVIEYLPVSGPMREAISRHLEVESLRRIALERGLVPMREVALALANQGTIDFRHLRRLMLPERLPPNWPDRPFLVDPDELLLRK